MNKRRNPGSRGELREKKTINKYCRSEFRSAISSRRVKVTHPKHSERKTEWKSEYEYDRGLERIKDRRLLRRREDLRRQDLKRERDGKSGERKQEDGDDDCRSRSRKDPLRRWKKMQEAERLVNHPPHRKIQFHQSSSSRNRQDERCDYRSRSVDSKQEDRNYRRKGEDSSENAHFTGGNLKEKEKGGRNYNLSQREERVRSKNVKKRTFDPMDFQRLVLSKGSNKSKPWMEDENRNVVLKEIEALEQKISFQKTILKDYSFNEYSGMLSMDMSETEDDSEMRKSDKDLIETKQAHISSSRKRKVFLKSRAKSSSQDLSDIADANEEDIDGDYMIKIMKDVVISKVKSKLNQGILSKEISSSEDCYESETKHFKPVRVRMHSHSFLSDSPVKIYPNPDSHLKLRSEEFLSDEKLDDDHRHERKFNDSHRHERISCDLGKVREALTLCHLPSPRPALNLDTFQSKLEPDIVEGELPIFCSASLYTPEVIPQSKQIQAQDQRTLLDSFPPVVKTVELKFEDHIEEEGGLAANKLEKRRIETKNNEVEILEIVPLNSNTVLVIDAENDQKGFKIEESYEEPSPEVFEHVDFRVDTKFTPITQRMHIVITSAMVTTKEVLLSRHNIDITKHDLFTLTGDNWLNDQIVEMFLAMIAQRSITQTYVLRLHPRIYSMSTYFFTNLYMRGYSTVEKWTKDVDIFSFDMVLVPIHMDSHWSLATIDFRVPGVFYYDSLGVTVNNNAILSALLHYLSREYVDKKGEVFDLSKFAKHTVETPLQENGSDCGVFCCKVGDYLSRDLQLEFSQGDIKYFRKRMIFEVLRGVLLEP